MKNEVVFDVYEYTYFGERIDETFLSLSKYLKKHPLEIFYGEVLITGRVCEISLKIGDTLIAESGEEVIGIRKLVAYGKELDFMSEGMTCAIIGNKTTHKYVSGEKLYVK